MFLFSITWGAVSGWWALGCLVLGLLYAWLMYHQPVNLGNTLRYILFGVRTLVVFVISFLLLAPLIKSTSYQQQKPLVLVLQDNSESVKLFHPTSPTQPSPLVSGRALKSSEVKVSPLYSGGDLEGADLVSALSGVKTALGDNYEVHEFNFDKTIHEGLSDKFNGKQTDISAALKALDERYVNRNIGAIILATDGLYNRGSDPTYEARNFKTTIYTVALGDTTPKRDLLIGNVNYNKTAFLGNDFEVEVLTEAYQSNDENVRLTVTENGGTVASQNIPVNSDAFQKLVTLKLNADKRGVQKFNISIAPIKNELSTQNNSETIYVDVLDAKQKILVVYDGPNPDINVLKQDIEINKNYEVKTVSVDDLSTIKTNDYSLLILHQLTPGNIPALQNILKGKIPIWYLLGGESDLQSFNMAQPDVKISAGNSDAQEVFPQVVPEFSAFTLSDSARQKIGAFPPLLAPFGSYTSSPSNQILFKQKIGNVLTTYPLLSFADEGGRRIGILTGEGLWRWQLAEYKTYGNHHAMEELLTQSVQYLTANANRQQFRAYPAKNVFDEGEDVILNAELHNDALELINTPDIKIDLKSSAGKNYSFLFTRSGQSYQLDAGTLPVDEYTYSASTKVGAKTFTANGQLTVKPLNLETRQSVANHQLLRNIAKQSGGQMVLPNEVSKLADLIKKNENIKTVVYEDKHYSDMIDVKWIFAIILILLSAEWFLRKREGEV